jgi:hypothetical protein
LGNYLRELVARAGAKANLKRHTDDHNISQAPRVQGRRYLLGLMLVLGIALTLFAMLPDKLLAAIELAYYRGSATANAVFLEWATVREVNVNGFEILCKKINDPDTAFHPIGSRIAMGSPTSGATYNFDITSGLIPGQQYCFRLREITSDNTPGEEFDLCGFGLGITPAPTPITVVVSIPITLTPTVVAVTQVPGLPAAPTLVPTIDPALLALTGTPTPTPTIDPFAIPSPPVIPEQPQSELPTPLPTPTETVLQQSQQPESPLNGAANSSAIANQEIPGGATQRPVQEAGAETPTETPTETPFATDTPLLTETVTQVATVTPTATITQTTPVSLSVSSNPVAGVPPAAVPALPDNSAPPVNATATPIYIVVTATPTPLAALAVAPTFTPWPTAVPTQSYGLGSLLVPNTQNLMVGLLCLIFLSASGLGALGLVTSVLYMRSQTRREQLPGPIYERRRY